MKILFSLFIFASLAGCVASYPKLQARWYKREKAYLQKYGRYEIKKDIVITRNRLVCVYHDGLLREIGKKNGDKRKGYWFFFKDSLSLMYIIKYNAARSDTIVNPYAVAPNKKW